MDGLRKKKPNLTYINESGKSSNLLLACQKSLLLAYIPEHSPFAFLQMPKGITRDFGVFEIQDIGLLGICTKCLGILPIGLLGGLVKCAQLMGSH